MPPSSTLPAFKAPASLTSKAASLVPTAGDSPSLASKAPRNRGIQAHNPSSCSGPLWSVLTTQEHTAQQGPPEERLHREPGHSRPCRPSPAVCWGISVSGLRKGRERLKGSSLKLGQSETISEQTRGEASTFKKGNAPPPSRPNSGIALALLLLPASFPQFLSC
jgi:hypothetical protein